MPAYAKAATAALAARHGGPLWAWPGQNHWTSPLGTPDWHHMPPFLTDNPLPQGHPWGGKTANNTNYYQETPNTGVTRHYQWTVSQVACNPDGLYENQCLLINDQFPGPTIEANWGDWVEVQVTNNIQDDGTSIHWHGLLQKDTPWMDGVPGNSQCPIAPGATFTYRWRADLYGTSWYHSHYSSQYASGLAGPIVIYGPKNVEYDSDLGPVAMSDYYHAFYETLVEKSLATPQNGGGAPLADNNLINGKASNGPAPMASFNFTSGKTYRLRLINTSAASVQKFSIDGYTFTIFANDFVPIVPYETDVVTLAVGQRSDIVVKASGKPTDAVWMRAFRPPNCGPSAGGELVTAAIFYEDADRSQMPTTEPGPNAYNTYCGNDPLSQTVPYYPLNPGAASTTDKIPIQFNFNASGNLLWYLQNQTFRIDYNDPILLETKLGNLDFPAIRSVHNYGTNNTVRIILENPGTQPHPMHLHGHNIFVLQEGTCSGDGGVAAGPPPGTSPGAPAPSGASNATATITGGSAPTASASSNSTSAANNSVKEKRQGSESSGPNGCWDGTIVNPNNPQRRDVQMLLPGNYIVIQWQQDNPGVWPLHCHIAWHLSNGFAWMVLENPDSVQQDMQIPSIMAQTCRDWSAWTGDHVVDQIDDGI